MISVHSTVSLHIIDCWALSFGEDRHRACLKAQRHTSGRANWNQVSRWSSAFRAQKNTFTVSSPFLKSCCCKHWLCKTYCCTQLSRERIVNIYPWGQQVVKTCIWIIKVRMRNGLTSRVFTALRSPRTEN